MKRNFQLKYILDTFHTFEFRNSVSTIAVAAKIVACPMQKPVNSFSKRCDLLSAALLSTQAVVLVVSEVSDDTPTLVVLTILQREKETLEKCNL